MLCNIKTYLFYCIEKRSVKTVSALVYCEVKRVQEVINVLRVFGVLEMPRGELKVLLFGKVVLDSSKGQPVSGS